MIKQLEKVEGLNIELHGKRVGVLTRYQGGKTILTFDPVYTTENHNIPFSLYSALKKDYFTQPIVTRYRIAPVLSNLLPEGGLRQFYAKSLKISDEDEFSLLAYTGMNLPGAIEAKPIFKGGIPNWALLSRTSIEPVQIDVSKVYDKFSLAGVQMKFSSDKKHNGRFTLTSQAGHDEWIIKTPSTQHEYVPLNEFSMMSIARLLGINVPAFELVDLSKVDNLPDIALPHHEPFAYAIKRYDRQAGKKIHSEDFAQIFNLYSNEKYTKLNYEQIASVLNLFSSDKDTNIDQMTRRLMANILLGNGDAHSKNWSMLYDHKGYNLTPAYDIVSTVVYIKNEQELALNLGKQKNWYQLDKRHFKTWADRADLNWYAVSKTIDDVLTRFNDLIPQALKELPIEAKQAEILLDHLRKVTHNFQINIV